MVTWSPEGSPQIKRDIVRLLTIGQEPLEVLVHHYIDRQVRRGHMAVSVAAVGVNSGVKG
jgi:hypothetical protein